MARSELESPSGPPAKDPKEALAAVVQVVKAHTQTPGVSTESLVGMLADVLLVMLGAQKELPPPEGGTE